MATKGTRKNNRDNPITENNLGQNGSGSVVYDEILSKLKAHVTQLDDLEEWLLVAVNTMKAIVDNSCKEDAEIVLKAAEFSSTAQIQHLYDTIQGMYGREGFSLRNDPRYYYLSSLVAFFPDTELSDADRDKIRTFFECDKFFIYEL